MNSDRNQICKSSRTAEIQPKYHLGTGRLPGKAPIQPPKYLTSLYQSVRPAKLQPINLPRQTATCRRQRSKHGFDKPLEKSVTKVVQCVAEKRAFTRYYRHRFFFLLDESAARRYLSCDHRQWALGGGGSGADHTQAITVCMRRRTYLLACLRRALHASLVRVCRCCARER